MSGSEASAVSSAAVRSGASVSVSGAIRRLLLDNPRTRELIAKEIETCSRDFKGFEAIRDFALSAEELTPANDMLTPTLKLKRRNVNAKYESRLKALYKAGAA